MNGTGFRNPPVQVGEEVDVKIEALGEKGDGIAKMNGFVLFVPGVKEGDEVRIKITKVLRKVGFAEVIGSAQGKVEESTEAELRPHAGGASRKSRLDQQGMCSQVAFLDRYRRRDPRVVPIVHQRDVFGLEFVEILHGRIQAQARQGVGFPGELPVGLLDVVLVEVHVP